MAADSSSFVFCLVLVAFLRFWGSLNAVRDEIDGYQTFLSIVIGNLQTVESIRKSMLCSEVKSDVLVRLDAQLGKIKVALKKAETPVNWISRDAYDDRGLHLEPGEILAWWLVHKRKAKAYEKVIVLCKDELVEIKAEMDRASKQRYPETSFEHIQQESWSTLHGRATKNALLYTGPPEQLSRSVANAIVSSSPLLLHSIRYYLGSLQPPKQKLNNSTILVDDYLTEYRGPEPLHIYRQTQTSQTTGWTFLLHLGVVLLTFGH